MVQRTVNELILDLKQRRMAGDRPPVLLMGAGASVESGIGAMDDLFAFAQCADFDSFVRFIEPQTSAERFRLLTQFLQTKQPASVTTGYQALAALCAEAYFDIILTLNLDPLLDDALANARLWRKDYLVIVNGIYRPDRLRPLLSAQSPRVKVLKLHGDLFHRFMAWTPAEMDQYVTDVYDHVKAALYGRDLLVVGTSLRDAKIKELVEDVARDGGAVWFTNLKGAPAFLENQPTTRAVLGPDSTFEKIFTRLAAELCVTKPPGLPQPPVGAPVKSLVPQPAEPVETTSAQTMDDFMTSVVALLDDKGMPVCTGFVLAEPRLIVADAFPARAIVAAGKVSVIAGGRPYTAQVLRTGKHPFGPLLLEAPAQLQVPGLKLNTGPLTAGETVSVGVAAGERTGLATGEVEDAKLQDVRILPIGNVHDLVQLKVAVAPGSSGAPVVDESFRVLGYIVAGSHDINQPVSYMYPSQAWIGDLDAKSPKRVRKAAAKRK